MAIAKTFTLPDVEEKLKVEVKSQYIDSRVYLGKELVGVIPHVNNLAIGIEFETKEGDRVFLKLAKPVLEVKWNGRHIEESGNHPASKVKIMWQVGILIAVAELGMGIFTFMLLGKVGAEILSLYYFGYVALWVLNIFLLRGGQVAAPVIIIVLYGIAAALHLISMSQGMMGSLWGVVYNGGIIYYFAKGIPQVKEFSNHLRGNDQVGDSDIIDI